jgi:uncharacterized membrane protein YkoI
MFEKLRLHKSIAALSAAAVTALGVGGIAIAQSGSEPAGGNEADEQQLTGPAADRAKAAALAEVGGGKVTDVSSEKGDANEPGEANEPKEAGDEADPAYQDRIAYAVEVTKADGSAVDVHLDDQFKVLGTEKADQGESGAGAEQADAPATAGG